MIDSTEKIFLPIKYKKKKEKTERPQIAERMPKRHNFRKARIG